MARKIRPKTNELSSREDFITAQFATIKKLNTICNKLFDLYYIDTNPENELSTMMRSLVPSYYVDPQNPEHPGEFMLIGKSSIPYIERVVRVFPYVNEKGKYEYDISGWRGLIIKPAQFIAGVKNFRKSKLEPLVVMGEHDGERVPINLVLREKDTAAKDEVVLPFLQLPNRVKVGEENYLSALERSIYEPCYQYLHLYIRRPSQQFTPIPSEVIEELIDSGIADFCTVEGDRVLITKELIPTLNRENRYSICRVINPEIDTSEGRYHYLIQEDALTPMNTIGIRILTLVAALQIREDD